MSGFEGSAVDRRIEGSIMSKGYRWEIVLHVIILGVITFGEAPIEVLHKALYNCAGSRVVRRCRYLTDAKLTIHSSYNSFDEFACFVVSEY